MKALVRLVDAQPRALRISQPIQPNQNGRLGGERHAFLRLLSFTPLFVREHFLRVRGVNDVVAYMAAHGSTPRHFP